MDKTIAIVMILFISSHIYSQSYSLEQPVFVPIYNLGYSIDSMDLRNYFWDISEINNNGRLDITVGLNQIENATPNNFIDANWYYNQSDNNFNSYNSSTRFVHQEGYQINISTITGLVFAQINSTSGKKDIVISKNDSLYVFKNTSGSINTDYFQRLNFGCAVQSSGKFTSDDVEDIAAWRNDSIFIFKGLGSTSKLDSVAAFKMGGASGSNVKFILAQVNSKAEPYATFEGSSNNRDEIIMRQGATIIIFNNNNSNGISSSTFVGGFSSDVDFKIADVNNDGYNDLVTSSFLQGIKIFMNKGGSIDTNAEYTYYSLFHNPRSIEVADFNKDGLNDLVGATDDSIKIFINLNQDSIFAQIATYVLPYTIQDNFNPLFGAKLLARDLHNKGGLSLVFSGFTAVSLENSEYPSNVEWMYRFNPSTLDAVPAPSILVKRSTLESPVSRPKLLLYNRGDRDFLQYKIYKKRSNWDYDYVLFDSTASEIYIDYSEEIYYPDCCNEPPTELCSYYVKTEDISKQLSINSDTIDYETYDTYGDGRPSISTAQEFNNIIPMEYSLKQNYPNPFNPSTTIKYELPFDGNVSIKIYDITGRVVMNLLNENKTAGRYEVIFDGNNFASGIYYYKIESGNFSQVRKMILIK